jgi:HCOMODA/2-hydroxy-3-carboxy-muconic semialdehyde decarboxylase
MVSTVDKAREEVAVANRILANEGVLDAFGHVSIRHPENPGRYLLSRSRSPELVEPADVLEYDLDSNPVASSGVNLYSERVIHGELYKARPDVMAVVHHHAPAMMPYCVSGLKLVPVFHLGAPMGADVPFWDQRDDFGDTNMLVVKPEEGASLARALGRHSIVLMRRHGTTVVGTSIPDLVLRTIYSCRNAEFQWQAHLLGQVSTLSPGEIEKCSLIHKQPNVTSRTWEYWSMRLEKSGNGLTAARAGRAVAGRKPATATTSRKSKKSKKKMPRASKKKAKARGRKR